MEHITARPKTKTIFYILLFSLKSYTAISQDFQFNNGRDRDTITVSEDNQIIPVKFKIINRPYDSTYTQIEIEGLNNNTASIRTDFALIVKDQNSRPNIRKVSSIKLNAEKDSGSFEIFLKDKNTRTLNFLITTYKTNVPFKQPFTIEVNPKKKTDENNKGSVSNNSRKEAFRLYQTKKWVQLYNKNGDKKYQGIWWSLWIKKRYSGVRIASLSVNDFDSTGAEIVAIDALGNTYKTSSKIPIIGYWTDKGFLYLDGDTAKDRIKVKDFVGFRTIVTEKSSISIDEDTDDIILYKQKN